MKFKFLGTGTSVGVPQIGCDCKVCTSSDPRDKRCRCGAYVTSGDKAFLIDTPPEMRLQCVRFGVKKVDAVLLTHAHMDHVAAFDDLRRFNTINGKRIPWPESELGYRVEGKPLQCYASSATISKMHEIFPYICAAPKNTNGLFRPMIEFLPNEQPFTIGLARIAAFEVEHAFPCSGYLIEECGKRLGYISDCHDIPQSAIELLKGADVLVLNCLRKRFHPTHMNLERSLDYVARIAPKKTYFVHMCHDFLHTEWLNMLKGMDIEPAYDGLELDI